MKQAYLRCKLSHIRSSSVAGSSDNSSGIQLPAPTWSLKDLRLTADNAGDNNGTKMTISRDQLRILARRAVLDLDQLKEEQIETLRRDVENMLYMMHVVETVTLPELTDEEIYDVPRGVKHTPLRSHEDTDAHHSRIEDEAREAQEVWTSLLHPKTVHLGGHSYFRIVTKQLPNDGKK